MSQVTLTNAEVWKSLYTKEISTPHGFSDYKHIAMQWLETLKQGILNYHMLYARLQEYDYPVFMTARKDLTEYGTRRSYNVPRHGASSVWHPSWLGQRYQTKREAGTSSEPAAHFTELGWRCGHFKQQVFGTNRSERKTIWIEPYIAHTRALVSDEQAA